MSPKFLRFKDLKARGIVNTWPTLARSIELEGFPCGRKLAANTRAWTEDEIEQWVASRPLADAGPSASAEILAK